MLDSMLDPAQIAPAKIRPLMRREYDRLVDQGWFRRERIELLRGQLVEMSPQGMPHSDVACWLGHYLSRALEMRYWEVRQAMPFAATDDSEPEPDITVTRHLRRRRSHPTTAALLIEVADSSLLRDRTIKHEIYAEAGVPEYWIVDVKSRTVEVLTKPERGRYARTQTFDHTAVLCPKRVPGVSIRIAEIPGFAPKRRRRR
jgi:Uma2 family endonuclease